VELDLLAEVNSFNIEGPYPELFLPSLSQDEAQKYLLGIGELIECLNSHSNCRDKLPDSFEECPSNC
jgi:hypothetical protein